MQGRFEIGIIGLGLIGGSLAQCLRGFRNARVCGADTNPQTLRRALADGVIEEGAADAFTLAARCDLVIVCLYPAQTVAFINGAQFKPGAVVTDVCGIKRAVVDRIRPGVDFVGGHPMAGREHGGYENASEELFLGASYILTPTAATSTRAVQLVRDMAAYIGCKQVVEMSPERHDQMAAFTSDLMHVVASALCGSPQFAEFAAYGAGSLRDCTRVADINADMWTELFVDNADALIESIGLFQHELDRFRALLGARDTMAIRDTLTRTAAIKRTHRPTDVNLTAQPPQ